MKFRIEIDVEVDPTDFVEGTSSFTPDEFLVEIRRDLEKGKFDLIEQREVKGVRIIKL